MRRREGTPERRPERIVAREAALVVGIPARTIMRMAARGEIPGAARFGRTWTFDEERLRAWVRTTEEGAAVAGVWWSRRRTSTNSVRPRTGVTAPWDLDRQYKDAMQRLLHPPRADP